MFYNNLGKIGGSNSSKYHVFFAPTQTMVKKWIREEFLIDVSVLYSNNGDWEVIITDIDLQEKIGGFHGNDYEELLDKGLLFSMEKLKK